MTSQNLITILFTLLLLAIIGIFWVGRYYYKKFDSQLTAKETIQDTLTRVTENRDGLLDQDAKKTTELEEYRTQIAKEHEEYRNQLDKKNLLLITIFNLLSPEEKEEFKTELQLLEIAKDDD